MSFLNKLFGNPVKENRATEVHTFADTPVISGGVYQYSKGAVLTGGSGIFGFQKRFDKPQYDLIGAGFQVRKQFFALQHPQVFAHLKAVPNSLGGLQAGRMYTHPLLNNDLSPVE